MTSGSSLPDTGRWPGQDLGYRRQRSLGFRVEDHPDAGVVYELEPGDGTIGGTIVDNDDFVGDRRSGGQCRQALRQKRAGIVVDNNDA